MNALYIFLGEFGIKEILFIVVIILLLFGGKKIPELMRGLGSGMKEFKNASKDEEPTSKPVSTDPIQPSSPTNMEPQVHKENNNNTL